MHAKYASGHQDTKDKERDENHADRIAPRGLAQLAEEGADSGENRVVDPCLPRVFALAGYGDLIPNRLIGIVVLYWSVIRAVSRGEGGKGKRCEE